MHFVVIGSYHPYLNTNEKFFEKAARVMMSESSKASPVRFQKLEVTYDSVSPYLFLIGTLVDPAPFIGKNVLVCLIKVLTLYTICH